MDWLGFYYRAIDESPAVVFGIFLCYFALVLTIGFTVYLTCMSSLYNVTLKQLFVGAFRLYFADLFLASGVTLLCLLPLAALIFANLAIVVLLTYLFILGLLIGFLIIPPFLVCQHTFDRIINKKDYPNYYGKGLSYGVYEQKVAASEIPEELEDDIVDNNSPEDDFERVNDGEN